MRTNFPGILSQSGSGVGALRAGVCRAALLAGAAAGGLALAPAHAQTLNINTPQGASQNINGNTTVNINATVSGSTGAGAVYGGGSQTITNSSTVTGTGVKGIYLDTAGIAAGARVTNTGTIISTNNRGIEFSGGGAVTNSGTIGGSGSTTGIFFGTVGVSASASPTVTNNAGGLVQGTTNGIAIQGAAGTITNAGTIRATSGSAILFGNFNNTLTNTGTIIGGGAVAVQFGNGNNTLILGTGSSFTGAVVGGTGTNSVILQGSGTLPTLVNFNSALTLNGTSWNIPTSTSIGSVTITSGQLAVDSGATLTSPVTIASGGTLSGFGTVVGAITNNGGVVKPGGSIGTLTVTGNYTQAAAGTLSIELSPSATSKLAITGAASLAGTLALIPTAGTYTNRATYVILTATNGVTGTFTTVTGATTLPGVTFSVIYLGSEVDLEVSAASFGSVGTPNQRASGRALDTLFTTATGSLATTLNALASLPTQAQILAGIDQLGVSAEGYGDLSNAVLATGRATTNLVGQQMRMSRGASAGAAIAEAPSSARVQLATLDPAAALVAQGTGTAPRYMASPWSAWIGGFGLFGDVGGNGNAHTLNYSSGGSTIGADYRVLPELVVGGFFGYAGIGTGTTGLTGTGNADSYSFGGYASYARAGYYVDGVLGYAYNDERLRRTIGFTGQPTTVARGNFQGDQFLASLETGRAYALGTSGFVATPFLGLQASVLEQSRVVETGAGALNLTIQGQNRSTARTAMGARLDREFDIGIGAPISAGIKLAWAHELSDTLRPVTASFGGQPAGGFTVQAAQVRRDSALVGVGVGSKLGDNTSAYVRYDGDLNGHNDAHAVLGGVRFTW